MENTDNTKNEEVVPVKSGEVTQHIMTKEEAQDITESIQSTAIATCVLLQRAHDQQAWKALGYDTWSDYINNEFKFSRARSYQLLAQGAVIKGISEASNTDVYLTEKEAKVIKKELPRITEKIKKDTKDIDDESERKEVAKKVVDDEISSTAAKDRNSFQGDIDDEESESDNSSQSAQILSKPDDELTEAHQEVEKSKQTSFYIENINRTLAVFQALPTADSIAESAKLTSDEKIKLTNDMKYAMAWMSSFMKDIK